MVEPTMFAVGFACGVIATVIGLILVLGTLRGNGGGRRNPPLPAHYKHPAPPPAPPKVEHPNVKIIGHQPVGEFSGYSDAELLDRCRQRFAVNPHQPFPPEVAELMRRTPPRKP